MRQRVLLKCSKLEEHWYLGCLYLGRKKKKISTSYVKVMKLQSNQNQYYSIKSMYWYTEIKGLVHPKMKIASWFTHPQAILGVYDFVLSDEYNQSYIKNFLAFPSFIMAVNGHRDFVQKVHLSIVKSAPHGSGWLLHAHSWESGIPVNDGGCRSFGENMLVSWEPSFVYSKGKTSAILG